MHFFYCNIHFYWCLYVHYINISPTQKPSHKPNLTHRTFNTEKVLRLLSRTGGAHDVFPPCELCRRWAKMQRPTRKQLLRAGTDGTRREKVSAWQKGKTSPELRRRLRSNCCFPSFHSGWQRTTSAQTSSLHLTASHLACFKGARVRRAVIFSPSTPVSLLDPGCRQNSLVRCISFVAHPVLPSAFFFKHLIPFAKSLITSTVSLSCPLYLAPMYLSVHSLTVCSHVCSYS